MMLIPSHTQKHTYIAVRLCQDVWTSSWCCSLPAESCCSCPPVAGTHVHHSQTVERHGQATGALQSACSNTLLMPCCTWLHTHTSWSDYCELLQPACLESLLMLSLTQEHMHMLMSLVQRKRRCRTLNRTQDTASGAASQVAKLLGVRRGEGRVNERAVTSGPGLHAGTQSQKDIRAQCLAGHIEIGTATQSHQRPMTCG